MKILLRFSAFILMVVYVFLSCKKDKDQPVNPPPSANHPPIANAGADQSFTLPSCNSRADATLNGSGSTDPDNNITSYTWSKIMGPDGFGIRVLSLTTARVSNLSGGEYAFELFVTDAGGKASRDTLLISVKAPVIKEYDFDVTFNSTFKFDDNFEDCYYTPCSYYDLTNIQGKGSFPPLGGFDLNISEFVDTAALRYADSSYISIYSGNANTTSLGGTSTVNWKKLFQQGGGPFTGSFTVVGGSAKQCDDKVFNNLPPLTVTGSLDTSAHSATIRITGKTFF